VLVVLSVVLRVGTLADSLAELKDASWESALGVWSDNLSVVPRVAQKECVRAVL